MIFRCSKSKLIVWISFYFEIVYNSSFSLLICSIQVLQQPVWFSLGSKITWQLLIKRVFEFPYIVFYFASYKLEFYFFSKDVLFFVFSLENNNIVHFLCGMFSKQYYYHLPVFTNCSSTMECILYSFIISNKARVCAVVVITFIGSSHHVFAYRIYVWCLERLQCYCLLLCDIRLTGNVGKNLQQNQISESHFVQLNSEYFFVLH